MVVADALPSEPSHAPLVPLLGCQLPGARLRLRWGAALTGAGPGGFALSPGCGCVDDLLTAAQEQRLLAGRSGDGGAKAPRAGLWPCKVRPATRAPHGQG